jgi:hypothetical protein
LRIRRLRLRRALMAHVKLTLFSLDEANALAGKLKSEVAR